MPLAVELQVDAAVDDPLAVEPVGDARFAEQVDRALLEHTGANPVLDVLARPVLEQQNAFNQTAARLLEELAEGQERTERELRQVSARLEALQQRLGEASRPGEGAE